MDTFALGDWIDPKDRKPKHTIFNCKGCLQNENWKDAMVILPVQLLLHQPKVEKTGLIEKQVLRR